jgi:hypothetical protein
LKSRICLNQIEELPPAPWTKVTIDRCFIFNGVINHLFFFVKNRTLILNPILTKNIALLKVVSCSFAKKTHQSGLLKKNEIEKLKPEYMLEIKFNT